MKMLSFLSIFIFAISAFAMNGRTTYQAKIVKPDGYPLEASSVNFKFTVLDPAASCVIYTETYSAINMTSTGGLISFALGSGIRGFPAASATTAVFENVFDNSITSIPCQPTGIYNPLPTHNRSIVMQFNDGNGWQTLPAMPINAVPYAMYAAKSVDSKTLNGKADTDFVENSTLAALNCNPATHAITFNGASFSCIAVGSGSGGITSVTTSGSVLSTGGTASAPVISIQAATMSQDGYLTSLDYAEFKAKLAASSTEIINTLGYTPVSSSTVASQIASSTLAGDVSGNPGSNTVDSVGGKTASQISTSVDETQAATSSSTADTIVKRNSLGNATFNDLYASSAKINYVDIYKPSTSFNIRLQAPTSLSTNYVLNLPTTSGTVGQVLSTDGSGNLSWISPTTGSVVSVSATAPLASTGGSNPTISITQATSSTDGYLSSSDWVTFNNKQQATSAAIIATLGYIPADNAASGTYAQKVNNLSDLTNIPQARTNLGLGTFATASTIDLGSASATGTLDIARLPSFVGDATVQAASNTIVLSNSGVVAGTYTKVTVDAKGRVTSSSSLSSSDVTTALGYTPATSTTLAASFVQKTGDTMTGLLNLPSNGLAVGSNQLIVSGSNVGIGVLNPESALHLKAGTVSNAPLKFTSGTLLSAAQSGTIEYDGSQLYFTDGSSIRRALATNSAAGSFDNTSSISNTSGNIILSPNNVTGSVIVNSSAASISSGTGALVVNGGVGVGGSINAAGNLNLAGSATIAQNLTLSSMTSGSLLFAGASGVVSENNSKLFWDGANQRLGVGTNSPAQALSVSGASYFSGNVGVGTLSPNAKLTVSGAMTLAQQTSDFAGAAGHGSLYTRTNGKLYYRNATGTIIDLTSSGTAAGANTQVQYNNSGTFGSSPNFTYNGTTLLVSTTAMGSSAIEGSNAAANAAAVYGIKGVVRSGGNDSSAAVYGVVTGGNGYTVAGVRGENTAGVNGAGVMGVGSWRGVSGESATGVGIVGHSDSGVGGYFYSASGTALATGSGNVGIGTTAPTAKLHLAAGSATTAPLKLTSGTLLSTPADGAIEYDGTSLYYTDSTNTRRTLASNSGSHTNSANNTFTGTNTFGGQTYISNNTSSTSSTTGALVVSGGVGIGGAINVAGNANVSGALTVTGAIVTTSNVSAATYIASLGTSGTPSYTFNGDTNTGVFSPSADTFSVATGGSERLRVNSSGNVAIGNIVASTELVVSGTATFSRATSGGGFDITMVSKGPNGQLKFGSHGGINKITSANLAGGAAQTLYIDGPVADSLPQIYMNTDHLNVPGANSYLSIGNSRIRSNGVSYFTGGNVGIGTTNPIVKLHVASGPVFIGASPSGYSTEGIVVNGSASRSEISFLHSTVGQSQVNNGLNLALVFGNADFNLRENGYMRFLTNNTEKLRIDQNGNVGVGTTSPQGKLDVNGTAFAGSLSVVGNSPIYSASGGVGIIGYPSGAYGAIQSFSNAGGTPRDLVINGSGGNVGIGTTSPVTPLHVAGAAYASNIFITGSGRTVASTTPGNLTGARFSGYFGTGTKFLLGTCSDATCAGASTNFNYDTSTNRMGINAGAPGSMLAIGGNASIGNGYGSTAAPTNGMIIEGNVGIGTTSPSYTLDVSGTLRVTGQAYTNTGNGSFSILSDIRYKDVHGSYDRGLAEILNIDIIKFNYKKGNPLGSDSLHEYVGVSAQNLQQVIPEAVEPRKDGDKEYLTINTSPVLWTLINAVKQLYSRLSGVELGINRQIASIVESKADKAEIEVLKQKAAEVDALKAKSDKLESENAALKSYLCSKDPAAPICK